MPVLGLMRCDACGAEETAQVEPLPEGVVGWGAWPEEFKFGSGDSQVFDFGEHGYLRCYCPACTESILYDIPRRPQGQAREEGS